MKAPTPTVEAAQHALEAWRQLRTDGEGRLLELTPDELEEAAAGLAEVVGWAKSRADADDLSWTLDYALLAGACAGIAAEKREELAAGRAEDPGRRGARAELLVRKLREREAP